MFCSIEIRDDLGNLKELCILRIEVEDLRVKDKLGKQNFHEDIKKTVEPVADKIKDTSEDVTKTMIANSKQNSKPHANLNDKLLGIKNDGCNLASSLLSPLSEIAYAQHATQFKLIKYPEANWVKNLLITKTIPNMIYDNLMTLCDTDKNFELKANLLKKITNENYNVDHAKIYAEVSCFIMRTKSILMKKIRAKKQR